MILKPKINKKLGFLLFEKHRYKVAHGGRGGGKSYSFADACLARMSSETVTVTICRELQTTIKDSVHQLIKDRISSHGLSEMFDITDHKIQYIPNGSVIKYKHLHNNIDEVKGLEGTDICWVFEAQNVCRESWEVLDPTIRKPGAEIWVEFNPKYQDDFIYQFFVVSPPDNCKVVQINYTENTLCPAELIKLAEQERKRDYNTFLHVWMGEPRGTGGRIYPKYRSEIHVFEYSVERIQQSGQLFMAMDPHTVYYPAIVWAARLPKGKEFEWVIYNEFPSLSFFDGRYYHDIRDKEVCSLTMLDISNVVKVYDKLIGDFQLERDVCHRYIDTRFAKASGAKSWSTNTEGLVSEFSSPKNGGLRFECPKESAIDVQRDNIRALLEYNEAIPICSINEPKIWVMPHCKNVDMALRNHRYDLDSKREDDKYKDFADAIRILLAGASKVSYEDPQAREEDSAFSLNFKGSNLSHSLK